MLPGDLHGLLLVDKPKDCTSHDVVHRARKLLNIKSIGHSGTLDPLASGLLVLLVGEATKLSDYILCENKRYLTRMQFGLTSDTLDRTGQTLTENKPQFSEPSLTQSLQNHLGTFCWSVPRYSAVKVQGQKLYEYARGDKPVEIPQREMSFFDLKIVELGDDFAEVEISCTKGSYIRTWVDQIGKDLGCGAVVDQLRRLRSEPFSIEQAVDLESLQQKQSENPEDFLQWLKQSGKGFFPLSEALPQVQPVLVLNQEERLLRNGQVARSMAQRLLPQMREANETSVYLKALSEEGELLAILEANLRGIKVRRVFLQLN